MNDKDKDIYPNPYSDVDDKQLSKSKEVRVRNPC